MQLIRPALVLLFLMTILTGALYPALLTGVASTFFAHPARGSLIERDGTVIGSSLVGQPFDDARYFWGRPSATAPHPANAAASSGSNQGPMNPALLDAFTSRVAALRAADPGNTSPVPVDLVTASGSGLDPHVSPAAAYYQAPRVAHARGLEESLVRRLVADHVEERTLRVFGEARVNVLRLNLALDAASPGAHPSRS